MRLVRSEGAPYLLLGGLIGLAVLAAAMLLPARGRFSPEPLPLARHALRDGRAELRLAPRSSSVFAFDERQWPVAPYAPAARDAVESGRWVGEGAGVVDVVLSGPAERPLPVTVAVLGREPRLRAGDSHVVDLDLLVDAGLVLAGTGSVTGHAVDVPPGRYRARFAGQGYRVAHGAERLRIELWPRRADARPKVRRAWPGWYPQPPSRGSDPS
jgi:hypothetical protein